MTEDKDKRETLVKELKKENHNFFTLFPRRVKNSLFLLRHRGKSKSWNSFGGIFHRGRTALTFRNNYLPTACQRHHSSPAHWLTSVPSVQSEGESPTPTGSRCHVNTATPAGQLWKLQSERNRFALSHLKVSFVVEVERLEVFAGPGDVRNHPEFLLPAPEQRETEPETLILTNNYSVSWLHQLCRGWKSLTLNQ